MASRRSPGGSVLIERAGSWYVCTACSCDGWIIYCSIQSQHIGVGNTIGYSM
jgi:hypothetical protein